MRKNLLVLASVLALIMAVSEAWAVKPPSVKDRSEASTEKHTWSDLKPGKKATTVDGKPCECGRSSTDPHACYYPKEGQYCCHPTTGDCHIVKIDEWNNPFGK